MPAGIKINYFYYNIASEKISLIVAIDLLTYESREEEIPSWFVNSHFIIIISLFPLWRIFVTFIVMSAHTVVLSAGPIKINEGGIKISGGSIIKF